MNPDHPKPPQWADNFLSWYCDDDFLEEIQGDLHEAYYNRCESHGRFAAKLLFCADVIRSISMKTLKMPEFSLRNAMTMMTNNLTIFFRKLTRRKAFAVINVIGLSVSFAGALLIFLYVNNELNFDRFNRNADNIYRVYCAYAHAGEAITPFAYTPPPLAAAVKGEIEGVDQVVRVFDASHLMVKSNNEVFNENRFYRTDSAFFEVFTARFVVGTPATALSKPGSVVLTKSTAEKYFKTADNALNKDILVNTTDLYNVSAVVEDVPANSHFIFDGLFSMDYRTETYHPDNWLAHDPRTYILLKPGTDPDVIQERVRVMTERILDPIFKNRYGKTYAEQKQAGALQEYRLQPLLKVHLYSSNMSEPGNIVYIYVFMGIGVMLIGIACFNYINLSTARSTWEAKSTGVRKVLGATKSQMYKLFLT